MTTVYDSTPKPSGSGPSGKGVAISPQLSRRQLGIGLLAFTVGGRELLLTPGEAHAQGAAFKTLKAEEVTALQAIGEALVPDAANSGMAEFIDHQLSIPAEEALLQARILNVRPPFANFYRAAVGAVDKAAAARHGGKTFAALSVEDKRAFINDMRQNKIDGWQGPSGAFVYAVLRSDAVDVVYSTVAGYEALGVPYMPHIQPTKKW